MESLDVVIKDYLETPNTDYAIMINGEWGCGKSHYLHHDFLELVTTTAIPNEKQLKGEGRRDKKIFLRWKNSDKVECYSPAFISLYGVSSVEDFEYKVFCGINEWADSKLFRVASLLGSKFAGSKGINTSKGDAGAITFLNNLKSATYRV